MITIGIPTYNGARFIKETLDGLLLEIDEDLFSRVDILVSDNGSTDLTGDIVEHCRATSPVAIYYWRNEENLGFDTNVDLVFRKARGRYVWLLGDDDVLYPGAIKKVLAILNRYDDLKVIQVNFDKYSMDLKKIVQTVKMSEDFLCQDAETFLRNAGGRWGAISSLIIKRSAWAEVEVKSAIGTQVIFAYGLFKILMTGNSFILGQPLVKVRDGSEKAVKVGDGNARLRIALAPGILYRSMPEMGYGPAIVNWFLKEDRRYAYQAIPLAKLWGIKDKIQAVKLLIRIHNGPELWFKWIPYIYFPDFLFRIFYWIRRQVSSRLKPIERKVKLLFK